MNTRVISQSTITLPKTGTAAQRAHTITGTSGKVRFSALGDIDVKAASTQAGSDASSSPDLTVTVQMMEAGFVMIVDDATHVGVYNATGDFSVYVTEVDHK